MLTEPGSRNLFIALTIDSAREILWEPFRALNDKHRWGFEFRESPMRVWHPATKAILIIKGCDDKRSLERLRGQKFRRIRIDECGSQRQSYLEYLVHEILTPAMMDYAEADLWLAGTPTIQALGFFYNITRIGSDVRGWARFNWTAQNNPYVHWARFLYDPVDGLFVLRGWDETNPIFQREYLALWVIDSTRLIFRFDRSRNVVPCLPQLRPGDFWDRLISLDFGVGHHTACAVLAYPHRWGTDSYIEESWQATGLAPSDAAVRIKETWDAAAARGGRAPEMLIGDVNGLGKGYEREWNKHHPEVAMRAALKADKRAALETTSDRLYVARSSDTWQERRGLFVLAGNDALCGQFATLQWDEERADVAEGQSDDLAHAAMYGYRYCPAYENRTQEPPPPPALTPFQKFKESRKPLQLTERPKTVTDSFQGAFRRRR